MSIEYRCPKCGSTSLEVTVELSVHIEVSLIQHKDDSPRTPPLSDVDVNLVRDNFGHWDEDSDVRCCKCGHTSDAWDFKVPS